MCMHRACVRQLVVLFHCLGRDGRPVIVSDGRCKLKGVTSNGP